MERKAKIYDKLRKGKTGGLNDAQYDALLVDVCGQCLLWSCVFANGWMQFDEANPNTSKYYEENSEDEDESLTVPKRVNDVRINLAYI